MIFPRVLQKLSLFAPWKTQSYRQLTNSNLSSPTLFLIKTHLIIHETFYPSRQLVIAGANLHSHPVSAALFGRSASKFDRVEYERLGSSGVFMLVGLSAEWTAEPRVLGEWSLVGTDSEVSWWVQGIPNWSDNPTIIFFVTWSAIGPIVEKNWRIAQTVIGLSNKSHPFPIICSDSMSPAVDTTQR